MTANILKHCIFDAKTDMRTFLKASGIHDFGVQAFGQEAKVIIRTHILTFSREIETPTSLYRSETRGDERMWFGGAVLKLTEPDDIYAVLSRNNELYIINITRIDIEACCQTSYPSPIKTRIKEFGNNA